MPLLEPLIKSVADSGTKVLDACLERGLDLKATQYNGQTLLHFAARWGQMDSVKWLIEHGAPIDAVDEVGRTPLMLAIINRHPELVQVFIDAKANIFIQTEESGTTARQFALEAARSDFEDQLKFAQIARLLENLGSREYLSTHLPQSKFDHEIVGRAQFDVSGGLYSHLSFLPPNYRFFAAVENVETQDDAQMPIQGGVYPPLPRSMLFAVLPNYTVVKLGAATDFRKLGLRLKSKADALQLVRVFTESETSYRTKVQFSDIDLQEIPVEVPSGSCLSVKSKQFDAAGLRAPVVKIVFHAGHRKYFVVTRDMISSAIALNTTGTRKIDHVTRIVEHIELDGTYTVKTEDISTPGLMITNYCIAL